MIADAGLALGLAMANQHQREVVTSAHARGSAHIEWIHEQAGDQLGKKVGRLFRLAPSTHLATALVEMRMVRETPLGCGVVYMRLAQHLYQQEYVSH